MLSDQARRAGLCEAAGAAGQHLGCPECPPAALPTGQDGSLHQGSEHSDTPPPPLIHTHKPTTTTPFHTATDLHAQESWHAVSTRFIHIQNKEVLLDL